MTQMNRRRRKKRRFYWVELGFLLLGLIGLRPEILTELFPNNRQTTSSFSQNNPYNTFYVPVQNVPVQNLQPVWQPVYQAPPQPQTLSYGYPVYGTQLQPQLQPQGQFQSQGQLQLQSPPSYASKSYDQTRIASNPSQVTSRYAANPGLAYGSTSSNSSNPPVVWPDGYQPNSYQVNSYPNNSYQPNTSYPPSGSNYYRR